MDDTKLASSLILAFFIASIFSGALVIVKEENKAVYNALKAAFGHHWVGHGIVTLILFAILAFIFNLGGLRLSEGTAILVLWVGVVLNLLLIAGYFIIHLLS